MPPIQLFWLECVESDLPAAETWLSDEEIACFRDRWVPKRRRDWILGRWTAKSALAAHIGLAFDPKLFCGISIVPAATGAPVLSMYGEPMGISLSISHRDGRALAVISSQRTSLGCDLEKVEPHTRAFVEHFFTPAEIEQVERSDATNLTTTATLIWSAKESVLKVLAVGLRVDTRCVSVSLDVTEGAGTDWQPFSAGVADGRRFAGWWHRDGDWLRTIACSGTAAMPSALAKSFRFAPAFHTRCT